MVAIMSHKSSICEIMDSSYIPAVDVYTLQRERERLDAAYAAIKAVI